MSKIKTEEASPAPANHPEVYRVLEAAETLSISTRSIRRLLKTGELRRIPQVRHILIPRTEILRLLQVRDK